MIGDLLDFEKIAEKAFCASVSEVVYISVNVKCSCG